ncbi:hypothetical protein PSAL_021280 [Pseudooceanicola algae]|uniref:Uncharacterized protein n=2 Tax=Pseudooceanicola algae TaxID=1537215 RepID=A0A418SL22_9RHOB|nr:hypothetical protein PSAL_021280 [Pseudooceanicola algae]
MLTGSISGAAQQLGIAQPTVTNTVRRLEDVLSVQLFNRSGARLRPTALARQIFDVAAPSMTAFEQITDRVNEMVQGKGTMFRLGVSPSVSQALGPRCLSIFRKRRPEMNLRMDTLSMKQNRDYLWMAEGNCTVTIFPLDDPGITSFRISSAGMVCVVPSEHPLARKSELTVHDIAEEPLIFFHRNTPHGELVRKIFESAGIEPNISIETRFAESAPHLMREGFGIALQDELSAFGVTNPALSVRPLAGTERQPILLHCRSDNVDDIEVREARRCLLQAAQELGLPVEAEIRAETRGR